LQQTILKAGVVFNTINGRCFNTMFTKSSTPHFQKEDGIAHPQMGKFCPLLTGGVFCSFGTPQKHQKLYAATEFSELF